MSNSRETIETIALGLAEIKTEEEALKVRKKKLLDTLVMPKKQKGTVTLIGNTMEIKVSVGETVSYDEEELLKVIEDLEDFDDYFKVTLKEKKKEVENLIKTGGVIADRLNEIREVSLGNPRITLKEKV